MLRRLQTESGHIECAPSFLIEALLHLRARAPVAVPVGELRLIGRRHLRSNNSWMHNAPRLVKGKPRHQLEVHPSDLAIRGIADGARARLRSDVGTIEVDVQATDTVLPGVVCLPHGFGHTGPGLRMARASRVEGASYNDLTDPLRVDGPSGNAALNGTPVYLEPLAG